MSFDRRDLLASWPGDDDFDWEHRLDAMAEYTAAFLLEVCGRLGWGSGIAVYDAQARVMQVGRKLGYPDRAEQRAEPKRRSLGPGVARQVWDRDGWECQRCGSHRDLTVDHIAPVAAGGTDDLGNLQTLCKPCNSSKGARV